jgi:EAL domain-containing protein (putative c-di-GMP-specific phosphodiesterase class I)
LEKFTSSTAPPIARSIISLHHNLGLEVVAEGVETNEALWHSETAPAADPS